LHAGATVSDEESLVSERVKRAKGFRGKSSVSVKTSFQKHTGEESRPTTSWLGGT